MCVDARIVVQYNKSVRRVLFGVVPLVGALVLPASPAVAEEDPVTCQRAFHITMLDGGLTFDETTHTFAEKGTFTDCSNGLTGTLEFNDGHVAASCAGGTAESSGWTIQWSDGSTSTGHVTADVGIPPMVTADGEIDRGLFAGWRISFLGYVVPDHPEYCMDRGVKDLDVTGTWTFG